MLNEDERYYLGCTSLSPRPMGMMSTLCDDDEDALLMNER